MIQEAVQQVIDELGIDWLVPEELLRLDRQVRGIINTPPPLYMVNNLRPLLPILADARAHFGGPLIVLSCWRSPNYNEAVGGAPASLHKELCAIDHVIPHVSPVDLADFYEEHVSSSRTGIGTYSNFVHLDTRWWIGRDAPARWTG